MFFTELAERVEYGAYAEIGSSDGGGGESGFRV